MNHRCFPRRFRATTDWRETKSAVALNLRGKPCVHCPNARLNSPHGPAAVVTPHLRATVDAHLVDALPGDRAVEQAEIAAGGANGRRAGAAGVRVRIIGSDQRGSI